MTKTKHPSETQETIRVAQWLKRNRVLFCHVPNEGARGQREASVLSMMGTRKGVPDLLIFTPPRESESRGVAIEMKRVSGAGPSPAQEHWLRELALLGWATKVCYGADEAITWLKGLGYGDLEQGE
jgi:hypothetical protein